MCTFRRRPGWQGWRQQVLRKSPEAELDGGSRAEPGVKAPIGKAMLWVEGTTLLPGPDTGVTAKGRERKGLREG